MAAGDLVEFVRTGAGEQVFVAANLGGSPADVALPPGDWRATGQGLAVEVPPGATQVRLGPWQVCLLAREA
jgi:hypothetical protein